MNSENEKNAASPPSNHAVRLLLGSGLLLGLIFAVVYFGNGGKIWLHPKASTLAPGRGPEYTGPIFIVESEEAAQKLTDVYGEGTRRGLSGSPDHRDDVSIFFESLYYEQREGKHLVCGKILWSLRPYIGYPGNIKRIDSTMDEIQAKWDELLHRYHPEAHYEWHPDVKTIFEERLKPYRYPQGAEP